MDNTVETAEAAEEEKGALAILEAILSDATSDEPVKASPSVIARLNSTQRGLAEEPAEKVSDLLSQLATVKGYGQHCNRILGVLRKVWKKDEKAEAIRESKQRAVNTDRMLEEAMVSVNAEKRPRGLPSGWVDPKGWACWNEGIQRVKATDEGPECSPVNDGPIWISKRWGDYDTKIQTVEVSFPAGKTVVPRTVVRSAREVVTLAACGAPVDSNTAGDVVAWFTASEVQNRDAVTLETSIARLGWVDGPDGRKVLQTYAGPYDLHVRGGHEQTATAMKPKGTLGSWLETAKTVNRHVTPAIMLAASVGSILLEPAGASGVVVDLFGKTSTGKTSVHRWAASAWGAAVKGQDKGVIKPWKQTHAAIESHAGFMCHLPIMLDDSQKANVAILKDVIYLHDGGVGKGRGTVDQEVTRKAASWRSVLLSCGEVSLTKLSESHGGAMMRVLPLADRPFEGVDDLPSGLVNGKRVNDGGKYAVGLLDSLGDYGHIGPIVAKWAALRWEKIPAEWMKRKIEAASALGNIREGDRIAGYLATILLAAYALRACDVYMPSDAAIMAALVKVGKRAIQSADVASEALDCITSWVAREQVRVWNKAQFIPLQSGELSTSNGKLARLSIDTAAPPFSGWIGRVLSDGVLALDPTKVAEQLKECGFEPEAVIDEWAATGVIRKGPDGKRTIPARLGTAQARFLVFPGMSGWIGRDGEEEQKEPVTREEEKPAPVVKTRMNPDTMEVEEYLEGAP